VPGSKSGVFEYGERKNRGPQGTPRDGMDGMARSSFSGFQHQFFENPAIFRAEMEKF
jgi:hypothetical protein